MATSGSTDFTVNRDEIIKDAMGVLGVLAEGESPKPAEMVKSSRALNMMVKQLMGQPNFIARGLKMWTRGRASLTLAAQNSFDLQPSGGDLDIAIPVNIISANIKNTNDIERPLFQMTLEEYEAISNKTAVSSPTKCYYERGLSSGVLYLDAVPSDTTDTIELVYRRILEDFDTAADNPDFPQEWYEPLMWNLALKIAPFFGVSPSQNVVAQAQTTLAIANTIEPERTTMYFQPGLDY